MCWWDLVGVQEGSPGHSKCDSLVDSLGVLGFMRETPFRAESHLPAPWHDTPVPAPSGLGHWRVLDCS